mgnify:CR=1 FL=1
MFFGHVRSHYVLFVVLVATLEALVVCCGLLLVDVLVVWCAWYNWELPFDLSVVNAFLPSEFVL